MVQGVSRGIRQCRTAQAARYIHDLAAPVVQAGGGQRHPSTLGGTSLGNGDPRAGYGRGISCRIRIGGRCELQVFAESQLDGCIRRISRGGQVIIVGCGNLDGASQVLLHIAAAGTVRFIRRKAKAPGGFALQAGADAGQLVFRSRPSGDRRPAPGGVIQPGEIIPGGRAAGLVPQDQVIPQGNGSEAGQILGQLQLESAAGSGNPDVAAGRKVRRSCGPACDCQGLVQSHRSGAAVPGKLEPII